MIRKTLTERKKEVKDLLSKVGISFFDNRDTNEFLVWPKGDKKGEDSTYFTLGRTEIDLEDALGSGLDMARRIKKQNPRCRTFQVKRKVGKKTIQVRRKVCNPERHFSELYMELLDLIGKDVNIYRTNKPYIVNGILGRPISIKDDQIRQIEYKRPLPTESKFKVSYEINRNWYSEFFKAKNVIDVIKNNIYLKE